MQLVVQYGTPFFGGVHDIVLAYYGDGVTVPMKNYPAEAVVTEYAGGLADLDRVGPMPMPGSFDTRAYIAPSVDLLSHARRQRWQFETGGVTVAGIRVATDDRSKILLRGSVDMAEADATFFAPFTDVDGVEHPLGADAIKATWAAVTAHVAAAFTIFSVVRKGISDGTVTTFAAIDAAFAQSA